MKVPEQIKEGNVLKSAGDITLDNAEVDINITPETPNAAGYGIAARRAVQQYHL